MVLAIRSLDIEYTLKYSRRKSIGIKIMPPGIVLVTAPMGMSVKKIESAIETKSSWIKEKLNELHKKEKGRMTQTYSDGDTLLYKGVAYPIKVTLDSTLSKVQLSFEESFFQLKTPTREVEVISKAVEGWYRKETSRLVMTYIEEYQEVLRVTPTIIRIKEQKKRLGSCSSKGSLNFNWRLSMAPELSLAAVVVHEMCHLVHLNHSKEFWNLVNQVMPTYKDHRGWFKDHYFRMIEE